MRSHPISDSFRSRWQLPVYFQLRRKEIILKLEDALNVEFKGSSGYLKDLSNDEKLAAKASTSVIKAIDAERRRFAAANCPGGSSPVTGGPTQLLG